MSIFDWLNGKTEELSPEDIAAREAVDRSAENAARFAASRGYMRDQELRERVSGYATAMRNAPTVPYKDTTPVATERNNRSTNIPQPLLERIVTTAQSTGVDPYKALAIALMETNAGTAPGDYSIINPMHSNEARVNGEFDAVPTAMAHIKRLEDRFPGNPAKATKAYNGLGKSYIPQKIPYEQRVQQLSDSLMGQPALIDIINNARKR